MPASARRCFAAWAASIQALAACPNVCVKLGGLGMRMGGFGFHEKAEPPSSETLAAAWRPYVETCIEAFGPSRCMFESNFPVDKGSYSYPVFWNACKLLAKGASARRESRSLRRHGRTVLSPRLFGLIHKTQRSDPPTHASHATGDRARASLPEEGRFLLLPHGWRHTLLGLLQGHFGPATGQLK